ncbi:MAG: SCO family protein [Cytophagales bacterium]|nr:SCO family protein [Cytophagales bacterium]
MNKSSLINSFLVGAVIVVLAACHPVEESKSRVPELPFYEEATFTPNWVSEEDVSDDFHRIPAFELVNQEGERITERHLVDRVTIVDFFFTSCPGICPKMTSNMMLVQEAFLNTEEVMILSHSVTPKYDSIPVLKEYAELKGIQSEKWHLLTGDRSVIYDLGRNQYFIEEDLGLEKDPEDFIHTENFVLIDQNRRIRGIYNGLNKTSVRQLIADVKTLLKP